MASGEFLGIEPLELRFPFELRKPISCSLQLSNNTYEHVAFKVKTTNPRKYSVRPNTGIVTPRSTCEILVTMQAQKEMPADRQCKDKFLVQSIIAKEGASSSIAPEMFTKESGNALKECKLRVTYVSPPQPPSPVPEGSEEGSSPRASSSDNATLNTADLTHVSRGIADSRDKPLEVTALISKLTEEKNFAFQQNTKLRRELELLRREVSRQSGGFSIMFVVIIAIVGIILGYFLKK